MDEFEHKYEVTCKVCGMTIYSRCSGQFVVCGCVENWIAIDETKLTCRFLGETDQMIVVNLTKDTDKILH